MKTIAELKVEIVKIVEGFVNERKVKMNIPFVDWGMVDFVRNITFEELRESLSRSIDEEVARCKEVVDYGDVYFKPRPDVLCKDVPPEQKCPGCKRMLKFKRKNLEG